MILNTNIQILNVNVKTDLNYNFEQDKSLNSNSYFDSYIDNSID